MVGPDGECLLLPAVAPGPRRIGEPGLPRHATHVAVELLYDQIRGVVELSEKRREAFLNRGVLHANHAVDSVAVTIVVRTALSPRHRMTGERRT
jgi:hypothetical protein